MKDKLLLILVLYSALILGCNLEPYSKGKAAYNAYCSSCHMEDGSGLAALIPPIAASDYYLINQDKIACIIINGQEDSITVNGVRYGQKMEGINLTPIQITNIINYMNQSWGNNIPVKSIDQVTRELEACNQ